MSEQNPRPPRDNLMRAVMPGAQFRDDPAEGDAGPTLTGHFAKFNEWTEIHSAFEGHFMERFAPRSLAKTIREGRDRMQVLFQHGMDPQVGDKPIADITDLREDEDGAYYEARLFDGVPPLIMEGLRAGKYGASFRFGVVREHFEERPDPSEHNPRGIPERTVKEARVAEFGPVTFPAYSGATAGVRSVTDEFLLAAMRHDPDRLRAMFDQAADLERPANSRTLSVAITGDAADVARAANELVEHPPMCNCGEIACPYYRNVHTDPDLPETADDPEPQLDTAAVAPDGDDSAQQDPPAPEPEEQQDAPSTEDDAAPPEPGRAPRSSERRETPAPKPGRPLYGMSRKETSKPWLLAPSKSTKQT